VSRRALSAAASSARSCLFSRGQFADALTGDFGAVPPRVFAGWLAGRAVGGGRVDARLYSASLAMRSGWGCRSSCGQRRRLRSHGRGAPQQPHRI
jgi:hypothetical protein